MRRARSVFAALLLFGAPGLAGAQEAETAALPADFASPFLPIDHWSRGALRKLDGLGLAPAGYVNGVHALTQRRVAIVLEHAAVQAEADAEWAAPLVAAYRARFAEEFGDVAGALYAVSPEGDVLSGSYVQVALVQEGGRVRGGMGFPDTTGAVSGPLPLPDRDGVRATAALSGMLMPFFAFSVTGEGDNGGAQISRAYVAGSWRNLTVWGGRRPAGFGLPAGGGLVLNGAVPLDGGGLVLNDPVLLPGFLGALGPIQFETMLANLDRNGGIRQPWFWSARGTLAPHPRVSLGLTRGVMFGGEGTTDISLRNLIFVFLGKHGGSGSEFDNHVISLDARYRPPVGALPLQLYIEWGFEDSAGAYKDVPGIVAGAEVVAVPGLPELSIGIERASFAPMCCGNPTWYRHWLFTDGWTVEGTPLGHPLGGHGSEWLVHAAADALDARLRLTLRAFHRDRGGENLFAPNRAGDSNGVVAAGELRMTRALELIARAALESGADWRESHGALGMRWIH